MESEEFENLVTEAIAALPSNLRQRMENVAIVVSNDQSDELLGLYQGVPRTERGEGYNLALPDKITIFRRPIEESAGSEKEIPALVRQVVWHEIGHHFGLSEKEIREIERKWRG